MALLLALFLLIDLSFVAHCGHAQSTPEEIRLYERVRDWVNRFLDNRAPADQHMATLRSKNKLQSGVPEVFPCAEAAAAEWRRSPQTPSSAHRVRPGDVDVVAAMGDSFSSSYGNAAVMVSQFTIESRGWSFSGGGEGTWREFLTLPNVLKELNANLTGYATGDALSHQRASRFNVAEGAAVSSDLALQARNLVKRMRADPRVDINRQWKMVTIMIGSNNFCSFLCYENDFESSVAEHGEDLHLALEYLQSSLPRTIVNLVITPNMKYVMSAKSLPPQCQVTRRILCSCLFGLTHKARRHQLVKLMRLWQMEEHRVGNSDRYRSKEDFVVLVQPFFEFPNFPQKGNAFDYSFFSEDCFHFSQKGTAFIANGLWVNLMEPNDQKTTSFPDRLFSKFPCPTEERPFIPTWGNNGGMSTP